MRYCRSGSPDSLSSRWKSSVRVCEFRYELRMRVGRGEWGEGVGRQDVRKT